MGNHERSRSGGGALHLTSVAFISSAADLGGAEQFLRDLAAALPQVGVRPVVYLPREGPLHPALRDQGTECRIVAWPHAVLSVGDSPDISARRPALLDLARLPGLLLGCARRLETALRRDRIDVLHTNGLKAEMLAGWFRGRWPRVFSLHDFLGRRPLARRLLGLAPRRPQWTFANSAAVLEDLCRPDPRRRRRSSVLYNPFDFARWPVRPARGEALTGPSGTLRVGLVATFAPWKGHLLFLEAAARVARTRAAVHFFVVGGEIYDTDKDARGAYARTLRERAERPDLAGRVTFTGFRSDVSAVIASLDICVHASTAPEPFGRNIVEALAVGRPVVAIDGGGVREILCQGAEGLLCPPDDAGAIAAAIIRLLDDPVLRASLAASGPASVRERFGAESIAAEAARVYLDLARASTRASVA